MSGPASNEQTYPERPEHPVSSELFPVERPVPPAPDYVFGEHAAAISEAATTGSPGGAARPPGVRDDLVAGEERTSRVYRTTKGLPDRFEYPSLQVGYGDTARQQHPLYRTSNADYGARAPTVHSAPTAYFPKTHRFSSHIATTGMYRNRSINL